ncbi:MAG: DUF4851 domain-containing protein [Desulfovibrio sp.]|nr:DUF4851 domain-containing protein [Desulfovibrio sp.]
MKLFALLFCIVVAAFVWYLSTTKPGPLQGVVVNEQGLEVLASRARPSVLFQPASSMQLAALGYKTVRPEDRRLSGEGVRVSFAVYRNGQGELVTALAESPGEWQWVAGEHVPYAVLRKVEEPYGDGPKPETLYESLFLLDAAKDPFPDPRASEKVLVYRAKFLLFFRKMQVLFEYREPLSNAQARSIDLEPAFLRDFAARGRAACRVLFPAKAEAKELLAKLKPLAAGDSSFNRVLIAYWLGELKHPGSNR